MGCSWADREKDDREKDRDGDNFNDDNVKDINDECFVDYYSFHLLFSEEPCSDVIEV